MSNAKSFKDRSDTAQAVLNTRRADFESQVDRIITLLEFVQKAVSEEITAGEGSKGGFVTMECVKKLQMVVSALEVAGRTKVAMAKAEKLLGSKLSPEQVLEGARKKIMSLGYVERARLLKGMTEAHIAEYNALHDRVAANDDAAIKSILKAISKEIDAAVADKVG